MIGLGNEYGGLLRVIATFHLPIIMHWNQKVTVINYEVRYTNINYVLE